MSKIPEVFAIFEQKLAHVLSFTVVPLKSKDLKNALEEILTYFSSIVERASKAESRIAELEAVIDQLIEAGRPLCDYAILVSFDHPMGDGQMALNDKSAWDALVTEWQKERETC